MNNIDLCICEIVTRFTKECLEELRLEVTKKNYMKAWSYFNTVKVKYENTYWDLYFGMVEQIQAILIQEAANYPIYNKKSKNEKL